MRVNVYAEEMTDRVEIVKKGEFTGLRFYLELPVTLPAGSHMQVPREKDGKLVPFEEGELKGPFMHGPDDDDSAAVTFWGKSDLRKLLRQAIKVLNEHYAVKKTEPLPEAEAEAQSST